MAQASCPLVQPGPHHKTTPMPKVQETVPVAERHVQNQAALKSSATGAASCSVLYKATIPSGATRLSRRHRARHYVRCAATAATGAA